MMNDHDLLVRMDEKLDGLSKQFSNHIRHHWIVTVPVIMIALGLLVALLTK
ncbi:hypothetical protein KAR91_78860 [Candidatus Pacearchaeota archaeon]|nr:hypothetical protein [Candidatus Pacearchaeota archaeon]